MHIVRVDILALPNGLSVNIVILAGFAIVLIIAAIVMLLIKRRRLQKEDADYVDDAAFVFDKSQQVPFIKLPPLGPVTPVLINNGASDVGNNRGLEPLSYSSPVFKVIDLNAPAIVEQRSTLRPVTNDQDELAATSAIPTAPNARLASASTPDVVPISDAKHIILAKTLNEANAVMNSLSDVLFEYDEHKTCINLWYNKLQRKLGDVDRFKGKPLTHFIAPDIAKVISDAIDLVSANGVSTGFEVRAFFGTGKWSKVFVSPVFDDNRHFTGKTTVLVTDITDEKQKADKIRTEQQQLEAAQKIAKLGDWWYDLNTRETYWAQNLYNILDIDALPKGVGHFEYYASRVVSEDRRAIYQFFADVEGKNSSESYHGIKTIKGDLKYFKILRGEPIRDAKGNISKVTGIIQDVTYDRDTESNIKRSRTEVASGQTTGKTGNWKWDLEQKQVSWSEEIYSIFEIAPGILHSLLDHFRSLTQYVHPEDKVILTSFLKDPANLRRTSYEFRVITPAGKMKFLSLIVGKIKDSEYGRAESVMGTVQDISDRRRTELYNRETDENYKLILDGLKLAAVSLDRDGTILFCNKYLANLLGYPQSKLAGLKWYERFVSENLQPVFVKWSDDAQAEPDYINPIIGRNGEERVIVWQNNSVYDEDGQLKQITCIGEDVTEQQKYRQQLIDAKNDAERASMHKSEFLSTMSHEIRTPMNAVIGTTQLLLDENPRPDQIGYLNTLKFSGENLLGIINDILDYNKIEAGKLELSATQLDLNKLVDNIKSAFAVKAAEKGIYINIEVADSIPKNLIGDPIRVAQILNNLVSNAIKFTDRGGVTILIREDSRTDSKVKINFTIADTGIGIEPKNLDRIFEPFVQEAQRKDYGGSGLGLAIIKKLVQLHGSDIKASSVLGKGTQFNFVIDFEYRAEPVKKAVLNPVQKMQEGNLSGMKVLVVDDNKMNILIASRFLNKWHIDISEANNGLIATQMAESNEFDLILMDLQMPVMDGFEATQIIKSKQPRLPIIALTADAMPETFAKTRNYGMDDYLTKPFMPEILFEKISRHYKMAV